MALTKEEEDVIYRIRKNCDALYRGWNENIEYSVAVKYHNLDTCESANSKHRQCSCPTRLEKRVRQSKVPGLLVQLASFSVFKDTDRNPRAERGAPRVKTAGRPPGDLAGMFAYDELICDIPTVLDRVLEEVGRDRTWACMKIDSILASLPTQAAYFIQERPDQARVVLRATDRWVDTAKATLKIKVGDSIFEGVLCGNCGVGGLSTPWGNRGEADVRCVGTPSEPPCGHTYPSSEWISLYERQKGREGA